jgi:hypothetical protein
MTTVLIFYIPDYLKCFNTLRHIKINIDMALILCWVPNRESKNFVLFA